MPSCERCSKRGKHYACWRMRIDYGRIGHMRGVRGPPTFSHVRFRSAFLHRSSPSESCLEYFSNLKVRSTLCGVLWWHTLPFLHTAHGGGQKLLEFQTVNFARFTFGRVSRDQLISAWILTAFPCLGLFFFGQPVSAPVRFGKELLEWERHVKSGNRWCEVDIRGRSEHGGNCLRKCILGSGSVTRNENRKSLHLSHRSRLWIIEQNIEYQEHRSKSPHFPLCGIFCLHPNVQNL